MAMFQGPDETEWMFPAARPCVLQSSLKHNSSYSDSSTAFQQMSLNNAEASLDFKKDVAFTQPTWKIGSNIHKDS